jgi:hypothetical protein
MRCTQPVAPGSKPQIARNVSARTRTGLQFSPRENRNNFIKEDYIVVFIIFLTHMADA